LNRTRVISLKTGADPGSNRAGFVVDKTTNTPWIHNHEPMEYAVVHAHVTMHKNIYLYFCKTYIYNISLYTYL
jgi:hypothetical protein